MSAKLWHKSTFRARALLSEFTSAAVRKPWWRLLGMTIGAGSTITTLRVNWPHRVSIGRACMIEPDVFLKVDGIGQPQLAIAIGDRVFLGRGVEFNIVDHICIECDALVSSGCKFIDHDHGLAAGRSMGAQAVTHAPIHIGQGAWLGANDRRRCRDRGGCCRYDVNSRERDLGRRAGSQSARPSRRDQMTDSPQRVSS
jgi:acetyltransferase-like isoleucine patch superfamily enzyme